MTVMTYENFVNSQNSTQADQLVKFLNKNKYFEIPFISKDQFSSEDWRKDIMGGLNKAFFGTPFQKPLGVSWLSVEPALDTFQGIKDQVKGVVQLTFADNSKKVFQVTMDGVKSGNSWIPEILRVQNHTVETSEGFNIVDRSTQIYGTSTNSKTPESADTPEKIRNRFFTDMKAKLKKIGLGRNRPEDSSL